MCLPAGERQESRDAALSKQSSNTNPDEENDVSEDYLREQFEEFVNVFGYDAYDDAENWWIEWGTLLERSMSMSAPISNEVPYHESYSSAVHPLRTEVSEDTLRGCITYPE